MGGNPTSGRTLGKTPFGGNLKGLWPLLKSFVETFGGLGETF